MKDQIIPVSADQIDYFFLENEMVYCVTKNQKKYHMDQSLNKIIALLDPEDFFRANRQYIVSRNAIQSAVSHFNRKLRLRLFPASDEEIFISKTKAGLFKQWLDRY